MTQVSNETETTAGCCGGDKEGKNKSEGSQVREIKGRLRNERVVL